MTNKEFFQRALWLDREIAGCINEEARLKEIQHGNERITALLKKLRAETEELIRRKEEVREVIDALPKRNEQMVMRCRYLLGMKWEDIAAELDVDPKTARRWHNLALQHAKIPEKK